MAGECEHLAPFRRVEKHGAGLGVEPNRPLGKPIGVGRGVPVGKIHGRQPVVASVGHFRPGRAGDARDRHHASLVFREFHLLHDGVEKHDQPIADRLLQWVELLLHEPIGAETKTAHPAVARVFDGLEQREEVRGDVCGRAGHGRHAVGLGALVLLLDRMPGLIHRRHAARRQLTADPVGGFDECGFRAALYRRNRSGKRSGAAASDHHVEVVVMLMGSQRVRLGSERALVLARQRERRTQAEARDASHDTVPAHIRMSHRLFP